MKLETLLKTLENEQPLDNIVEDGGYCSIFQTICCIGDSLSSGEFEAKDANDVTSYHDYFNYSWGQFIARDAGVNVYNFSRGGMTASEYMKSFGESIDAFNIEKKAKAYIIALGVNDLSWANHPVGDVDDKEETNSFAYWYQKVIERYKQIEPNAFFFLVTFANENKENEELEKALAHRDLLYKLASKYEKTYVIDLYKYGPVYDKEFKEKFFLHGHMNPAGYKLTAKMIESYIDYIVRSDFPTFKQVGFIGTEQYDKRLEK